MNKLNLLLICLVFFSCRNSNPGSTMDAIENQLLSESESIEKESVAVKSFKSDSTLKHFNLKERRNSNKSDVVTIDLTQKPQSKDFVLSDIGTDLEYITLQHIDSMYFISGRTNVLFSDNYIVTSNIRGVCLFTLKGEFVSYIVKNEVEVFISKRGNIGYGTSNFKGVWSKPFLNNNQLFYVYTNIPEKYKALYSLDLNRNVSSQNSSNEILGVLLKEYGDNGCSSYIKLNNSIFLGFNSFWNILETNELFYSFNENGDTLCTFNNYDPIGEFNYRNYQMAESGDLYFVNNELRYRQAYNDTIYQISGEDELEPKYILHRGNKGLKTREGAIPGGDLSGKILINQIYEADNWIIIVVSNNHSSPNNKKAGKVEFQYWFYNKLTKNIYTRNGMFKDERNALENTIDNGLDFWPTSVSNNGEFISTIPAKYLIEDYSEQELKTKLPFNSFSSNDLLVTILK